MKWLILLSSLLIVTAINSQNVVGIYKTTYKSKLSFDISSYEIKNPPKTKEDSILLMVAKQMASNTESQTLTIPTIDSVFVYADSSVVVSTPVNNQTYFQGQKIEVNTKNSVLKNGYSYSFNKDGEITISERQLLEFRPLNEKEKVLDHECELWISIDSTIKVWISKKLPFLLSPGFKIPSQLGGVLKLELNERNTQIISEIQEIKLLE